MKQILIYSPQEAERNAFSVEKFKKNLGARLVTPDYRGECDCVINRTNDYHIAEYYESRGIRVFNGSRLSKIANDKQLCYDIMEQNGVEIMPTRYSTPPFVKKPKNGHGGQGVVMCNNISDYDTDFVCQKPASDLGKDLRVWVIGDEIITSVLRQSSTDFRSNFCLGGTAVPYSLSPSEIQLVRRIMALAKGDYYGIDFVFDGGKPVFNEIEDTVGARMVYSVTDIDILDLYCDYIKKVLDK